MGREPKTGSFEEQRDRLMGEWVRGSQRRLSIILKLAVKSEFGLRALVYPPPRVPVGSADVVALRPVVRRMYEETQVDLHRRGIATVRLYRGIKSAIREVGVLQSWTSDPGIARRFSDYDILLEDVEASRIFMYHDGPGWRNGPFGEQEEYLVMSEVPR